MKKVATNRWPLIELVLIPTLVQGESSKFDIVDSIKYANSLDVDLIVVGRGGGSIEDLWAFNEEIVADAIFSCTKPVISAVGHETDFLISDFVADIRAATPSNAMEISLPDINENRIYLDNITMDFDNRLKNIIARKEVELKNMYSLFEQNSLDAKFNFISEQIKVLKERFTNLLRQNIQNKQSRIELLKEQLLLSNPDRKYKTGYAQLSINNKIVNLEELDLNDKVTLQTPKTIALCTIEEIKKQ